MSLRMKRDGSLQEARTHMAQLSSTLTHTAADLHTTAAALNALQLQHHSTTQVSQTFP
jgi:hypothetical protein